MKLAKVSISVFLEMFLRFSSITILIVTLSGISINQQKTKLKQMKKI